MMAKSARSALAAAVALVAGLTPALTANGATHRPPAQAPTTFRVVAHLSTHVVRVNHSAAIAGSVVPARAGQKVYLQQESMVGSWHTIAATKLNAASEYSFTVTPIASGAKYYRVLKLRDRAVARAFSPIKRLSATRWFDLDSLPISQFDGFDFVIVTINGFSYDDGIAAPLSGTGDLRTLIFQPGRKCTKVKGTLGLDDASAAGSSVQVSLVTDGVDQLDATLTVGQPQTFQLPLNGVGHLKVVVDNLEDTDAYPAIAGAGALCAFQVIH